MPKELESDTMEQESTRANQPRNLLEAAVRARQCLQSSTSVLWGGGYKGPECCNLEGDEETKTRNGIETTCPRSPDRNDTVNVRERGNTEGHLVRRD